TLGERIDHKTAQRLWRDSPVVPQERLPLRTMASPTAPYQMRLQVIQLYYQGWDKVSISRFLHLARTTIDRWIARFEAEHLAGLVDPTFKGVWHAAVNFAPLPRLDTRPDQSPQLHRRADDGPGRHGPGGLSHSPWQIAPASPGQRGRRLRPLWAWP